MTKEKILDRVREKNKDYDEVLREKLKPGDGIETLRKELNKLKFGDTCGSTILGHTSSDPILNPRKVSEVPDHVIDDIENIESTLDRRTVELEGLDVSDQELGEFSGILNPVGEARTRVVSLDTTGDD